MEHVGHIPTEAGSSSLICGLQPPSLIEPLLHQAEVTREFVIGSDINLRLGDFASRPGGGSGMRILSHFNPSKF
jgi:hypothetical protein